jgi:TDG/mug DNA glycosylase family protein
MKPSKEQLAAAQDGAIADVIAPGLRVLFCGINPGLWSGATGRHFARPGNRFWPALHRSGFTPRQFLPEEQEGLLPLGLGITNVVPRTTARAAAAPPAPPAGTDGA